MRHWRKLGLLYCPGEQGRHAQLLTHAANPLPVHIEGDTYRIFYSGRDAGNRSSVGAVDIDIVQRHIVKDHSRVFFPHGPPGSFYADGVSIGNCYQASGVRYMLFMGWQRPAHGHWRGDIGRLIVHPDLTLSLESQAPFMGMDAGDTVSLSYPWVAPRSAGGYDMWYGSTTTWDAGNGEMLHIIKHADSPDGHHWTRNGPAVPYVIGQAQAFSRPTVAMSAGVGHEMWFSFRSGDGQAYRIGYATSHDARTWILEPGGAGINVSIQGWDSEMIEYPFVFDHAGRRYMLYNGNGYGRTGFGLAVLDMD